MFKMCLHVASVEASPNNSMYLMMINHALPTTVWLCPYSLYKGSPFESLKQTYSTKNSKSDLKLHNSHQFSSDTVIKMNKLLLLVTAAAVCAMVSGAPQLGSPSSYTNNNIIMIDMY